MSDLILCELPNLKTLYIQELGKSLFFGLTGSALQNDIILNGISEYAQREKMIGETANFTKSKFIEGAIED